MDFAEAFSIEKQPTVEPAAAHQPLPDAVKLEEASVAPLLTDGAIPAEQVIKQETDPSVPDELKSSAINHSSLDNALDESVVKMKTHQQLKCSLCHMVFTNKFSRFLHMRKKHQDQLAKCTETGCSFRYFTPAGLEKHVRTQHPKFECQFCRKRFLSQALFLEHVRIGLPCVREQPLDSTRGLLGAAPISRFISMPFFGPFWVMSPGFTVQSLAPTHMIQHITAAQNEDRGQDGSCSSMTLSGGQVDTNASKNLFRCPLCSETFSSGDGLLDHMENNHH